MEPNIEMLLEHIASARPRFAKGNSFRVFHGRGNTYPGYEWLCIDFFAPVLLITVYKAPPPNFLTRLAKAVHAQFFCEQITCVAVQRRDEKRYPLEILAGEMPDSLVAVRDHLRFNLQQRQQNVGYFLDIEPARVWLEGQAKDKNILNLFSFTCTFSVVAQNTGAKSVLNMDMNRNVLSTGRENHRLNGQSTENIQFLAHDILRSWGKIKRNGPYDIVIVDPPSMQKGSFEALKDYPKIIRKLPELLCANGLALLCLNAPEISCEEFVRLIDACGQPLRLDSALPANHDFPDSRESSLKMLVYSVESAVSAPPL